MHRAIFGMKHNISPGGESLSCRARVVLLCSLRVLLQSDAVGCQRLSASLSTLGRGNLSQAAAAVAAADWQSSLMSSLL